MAKKRAKSKQKEQKVSRGENEEEGQAKRDTLKSVKLRLGNFGTRDNKNVYLCPVIVVLVVK